MSPFWRLVRDNPNYRRLWLGQIVSEVGDHFNSIAVLSLTLHLTGSGFAVGAVMIARVLPAILAGPVAGVWLDRHDRRQLMLASDLARAVIALGFVLIPLYQQTWLIYLLSGALMFASPFFTSGRSAILPTIAGKDELPTANALTQTTQWLTLALGTMFGGISTMRFGYEWAFVVNSLSFVVSAWAVWGLRSPLGHFRASEVRPRMPAFGREFWESIRYIRRTPLILAIGLAGVGWATGGGAAQILFTLFGEVVFKAGAAGVGLIWGSAGFGLVAGGLFAHWLGKRLGYTGYKRAISLFFFIHGAAYILYSRMPTIFWASVFIFLSRVAMGANSVLNRTMLLTHIPNHFRGRVLTTVDTMSNTVMMISLGVAGAATEHYPIRDVGTVAGILSASTALFWAWADFAGKLPEPPSAPEDLRTDLEQEVTPA